MSEKQRTWTRQEAHSALEAERMAAAAAHRKAVSQAKAAFEAETATARAAYEAEVMEADAIYSEA